MSYDHLLSIAFSYSCNQIICSQSYHTALLWIIKVKKQKDGFCAEEIMCDRIIIITTDSLWLSATRGNQFFLESSLSRTFFVFILANICEKIVSGITTSLRLTTDLTYPDWNFFCEVDFLKYPDLEQWISRKIKFRMRLQKLSGHQFLDKIRK